MPPSFQTNPVSPSYDDMAASMKTLTESGLEFSEEERRLLSVAYKVCPAELGREIVPCFTNYLL